MRRWWGAPVNRGAVAALRLPLSPPLEFTGSMSGPSCAGRRMCGVATLRRYRMKPFAV